MGGIEAFAVMDLRCEGGGKKGLRRSGLRVRTHVQGSVLAIPRFACRVHNQSHSVVPQHLRGLVCSVKAVGKW